MRTLFPTLTAVILTSGVAHAAVLYDSGGFEGPEYPVGTLTDDNGWTAGIGTPQPQIVDLDDGDHEKVLEIYRPLLSAVGNSNNRVSIDPKRDGVLTLNFDYQTNTNFRSVTLAVSTESGGNYFNSTTTSLTWGRTPGEIEQYSGGWQTIGTYALDTWQSIEISIYLSGANAGTFDFQVDGNAPTTGIPWRTAITLDDDTRITDIWFQGTGTSEAQGGGLTSRYGRIDNLVVTWVPEPASLSLLGLGGLLCLRRR